MQQMRDCWYGVLKRLIYYFNHYYSLLQPRILLDFLIHHCISINHAFISSWNQPTPTCKFILRYFLYIHRSVVEGSLEEMLLCNIQSQLFHSTNKWRKRLFFKSLIKFCVIMSRNNDNSNGNTFGTEKTFWKYQIANWRTIGWHVMSQSSVVKKIVIRWCSTNFNNFEVTYCILIKKQEVYTIIEWQLENKKERRERADGK